MAQPLETLFDRNRNQIIIKLKSKDFVAGKMLMTPISDMVERMLSEGAPAVAIVAAIRAVEEIKKDAGLFDEPDPSEPERELFKRGRAILGKTAGGQIAKLKAACGGNVALARSRLELAATKDRPAEFIAAIIRGPVVAPAKPLTQHQQERQQTREILDALEAFDEHVTDSRGETDIGLLRHNTGIRSESVRGGSGGNALGLSLGRSGPSCKSV